MDDRIICRPIGSTDYDAWRKLWENYLTFYRTALSNDMIERAWQRLLSSDADEFSGIVATINEEVVGLVHFLFHRHGWFENKVCYLQDLFVSDLHRHKGVGKKLIEAVYDVALKHRAPKVYWLTEENNIEARKLYDAVAQNAGFIEYQKKMFS